jgi:hypothetical protein
MSVSWYDTSALEDRPDVFLDVFRADVVANGLLHVENELENFLVGKTVQRTSKTG